MDKYAFFNKKLMTPGPVPMPEAVKQSLAEVECHHRSKEFGEILTRVFTRLPQVFQTKQHCYLLSCTGSGGLEAAVTNTLTRNRKALFINAGKFGERWGKIAKAFSIPFDELVFEWGEDIDLNQVREKLSQGDYQALAWQACETSSGALLPTKELAQICQEQNVLSLVDGITALGAAPLPMDEWGLDVVIGGSQKAFMLPTGMAFVALSERAESIQNDIPKYYFDLKAEKKSNLSGKTRYSTPTQFVIGLDIVLDEILNQVGLAEHLKEVARKAQVFRNHTSLPLFPITASPSLSCLKVPEGLKGTDIKNKVAQEGFVIVAGQDRLKDSVLRVGHMGAMTEQDLIDTAQAIEKHL